MCFLVFVAETILTDTTKGNPRCLDMFAEPAYYSTVNREINRYFKIQLCIMEVPLTWQLGHDPHVSPMNT